VLYFDHWHLLTSLENGDIYPILELITPQINFNETAYAQHGTLFVGTQLLWGIFFDYASYTSVMVWMVLFGYPHVKATFSKYLERRRSGKKLSVNQQYSDRLNVLMRSYDEVPLWWFVVLFLISFTIIVSILAMGYLYIPIWTYFIALATGAIVVIVRPPLFNPFLTDI
jgi:hypothetical protein